LVDDQFALGMVSKTKSFLASRSQTVFASKTALVAAWVAVSWLPR